MNSTPNPLDMLKNFNLSNNSLLGVGTIIGMKRALLTQQNATSVFISDTRIAIGKEISEELIKKTPPKELIPWGNQLTIACAQSITFTDEGIKFGTTAMLTIPQQDLSDKGFTEPEKFVSAMNSCWNNLAEISVLNPTHPEGVKLTFKLLS